MALGRDEGGGRAARRTILVCVASHVLRARERSPAAELRRRARLTQVRLRAPELAAAELASYFDDPESRGRLGY